MPKTLTSPQISVEVMSIDLLKPDPANPRKISDAELEALTRSLQQWGFVQPVLARREDRVVVGGHQRLLAARKLGIKTVPVIFLDLKPEQARLLNVALNKISGDWDQDLLAHMLADLQGLDGV
ncbi:MAG: ParB N-terminal domain-containing protein, partial [Chloroflexi bacterium]|nr:ParB N-terminal domain-containing protein [Chloroflexota bacterium]